MSTVLQKLKEMGYSLPDPWPSGKLERAVQAGSLAFTSGAGSLIKGKLGKDLDIEEFRCGIPTRITYSYLDLQDPGKGKTTGPFRSRPRCR